MRQHFLRKPVQFAYLFAALDFAPDLVIAEIPRVALEQGDFVQPLRVVEQALQGLFRGWINLITDNGRKAALFMRQCPADHVLHGAVSRSDDALLREEVHQFPEDIDGLAADRRRLSGARFQLLLYCRIRVPVMAERQG